MQRNVHCKIVVCQVISVVNDEIYTKLKLPNLKEIITVFKNVVKTQFFDIGQISQSASLASLCSATTYADNVALPAFARRMPAVQQSIDISCSSKLEAASLLLWAGAGTGVRTDGRTPYRYIDPDLNTTRALPKCSDSNVSRSTERK